MITMDENSGSDFTASAAYATAPVAPSPNHSGVGTPFVVAANDTPPPESAGFVHPFVAALAKVSIAEPAVEGHGMAKSSARNCAAKAAPEAMRSTDAMDDILGMEEIIAEGV